MQSNLGQIELTQSEQALANLLSLSTLHAESVGKIEEIENGKRAEILMLSLLKRNAIPGSRWRYFYMPKYNVSHPRTSRYTHLLKNIGAVQAVYRHRDFRDHLRYFVFGANLPDETKEAFHTKVVETNRNRAALTQLARHLIRQHQLDYRSQPSEKFYQLALDSGLEQWDARALRDSVKNLKLNKPGHLAP